MFRLRLLKFILLWLLHPKKGLMDEHVLEMRAWPFIDVDVTRMFLFAFVRGFTFGRYQLVFGSEFRGFAFKRGWYPMTTAEINYLYRPVKIFEKFTIHSRIICWNERKFYAEQILKVRGTVRSRSLVEGLIGGPGVFLKPTEVFKEMGILRDSPPMTAEVAAWIENRPRP